ncbi:putative meiosis specific protein hop1 [Golovinomyces cichoracearum]|uniref:Putative meiosis specific protein hop1 n=1 Tax=Golovinomyces cichoracearum TaxID=62708 RepID=A0A420J288_9PEZI|nr:putative meiosis specific protein hop1 [Golovinomyces cichoracearum]
MPPQSRLRLRLRGPTIPPASQCLLTQKHSFELMKTVITATISHVLWARRVFPNVTYNLRSYDPADPEVSYDSFVRGIRGVPVSFDASENLMIWKILPRSQDPAVDKILDCLEIGAADALERGYLAKLQVSLHSTDENVITDQNLIESYTMIFEYDDDQNLQVTSELDSKSMVVRRAKQDLYGLVNDVGFLIHHNNRYRSSGTELPDEFRMLLSLKYNNQTPTEYQPPMFRPGDANTITILRSGRPNPNLKMSTGFHSVTVGIHILESEETTSICRKLSKNKDSDINVDLNASNKPAALVEPEIEIVKTQPDAVKQLQKIGISRKLNSDTQDTIKLDSFNSQKIEAPLSTHQDIITKQKFPIYIQSIQDQIKLAQARNNIFSKNEKSLACECNVAIHHENLFNCAICGNSKHLCCYGYIDGISPTDLVCYSCLLMKSDKDRIENLMKPLAIKRRALFYLREKGKLSSSSELAPQLNLPKYKITRLLGDFKSDGLVKGCRKDNKKTPMATYIGNDEKLRELYFRPQQEIEHFFTVPKLPALAIRNCNDKEIDNSIGLAGAKTPRHLCCSSPDRSSPPSGYDQRYIQTNTDIESSNRLDENQSNQLDLLNKTATQAPAIVIIGSSTQGTPSPGPCNPSIPTYEDQDGLEGEKFDEYNLRKRSYTEVEAVNTPSVADCAEEKKRPKTSKASPWLIRHC